jgi:high-affinity iron transporter
MAAELVPTMIGTLIGLAAAAILGYGLYSATIQLDLRLFFQATGALLVLFAAGLGGHGTHELVEAGVLPAIISNVWDLRPVLDDNSNVGLILKTLFGYNANPTLVEAIAYLAYLAAMILFLRRRDLGRVVSQKA